MSSKRKKKKSGWLYHWRKRLRKRTRRPRHLLIYGLARLVFALINLLPIDTAIRLGGRLGSLSFWLMPHLRHLTRRNLERVLGSRLPAAERESIARRVFDNAGRGLVEMMTFHRWDKTRIQSRIHIEASKTLPDYQADHEAVMVIGAHTGAWEFPAAYASAMWNSRLVAVVRDLSNPYLEQWLRAWRGRAGLEILHRGQAGLTLFRKVKEGHVLCMLVDQFIDGPGVELPFMGLPAHTFLGPAIIAQRLKAKVIVVQMIRQHDGFTHVMKFDDLIVPDISGLAPGEQAVAIAGAMNDAMSAVIEREPAQWMWFHERWRRAKKKYRKSGA